jgi:hypothetical protein
MGKYHNKKTEIDGIVFDSAAESRRWAGLKLAEKCGDIVELQRQVVYKLVVNEQLICKYIADFVYHANWEGSDRQLIVEDVKSEATRKLPVYRLKKKLMAACYGIEIVEVSA